MKFKTNYYVGANTAEGFINLIDSNVDGIRNKISLSHPSHRVKTMIIQEIIDHYEGKNDLEIIHSAFGKEFLDGVIIRDESLAVFTDLLITPELKDVKQLNINKRLQGKQIDFTNEASNIQQYMAEAYDHFLTGLKIHDQLEKIFIDEMDFSKADRVADRFIHDLFKNVVKNNRESVVYERLFGTSSADGVVTVVPQLMERITNRHFIKGRAGTGKSYFMKRIISQGKAYGLDMEVYYCSFDPESVDMVIIRDLDFCIFDSTDPHEFFPERPEDRLIDLYEETVNPGTDEKYANEIQRVNNHYKSYMKKGVESIKEADKYRVAIESRFAGIKEYDLREIVKDISGRD